jgi:hypothetical protein
MLAGPAKASSKLDSGQLPADGVKASRQCGGGDSEHPQPAHIHVRDWGRGRCGVSTVQAHGESVVISRAVGVQWACSGEMRTSPARRA